MLSPTAPDCSNSRPVALAIYDVERILVLETQVELLIRAHDSFTLSCNMEGISEVLRTARVCTLQLVENKAYSLMVSAMLQKNHAFIIQATFFLHSCIE